MSSPSVSWKLRRKQPQQGRRRGRAWPMVLIFVLGLFICSYPFISQWYYRAESRETNIRFDEERKKLQAADIERRMDLARAYNSSIVDLHVLDPFNKKWQQAGRREYARMLEVHEQIGYVRIPRIQVNEPIYAGVSEEVLQRGIGHLENSSLPVGGQGSHAVLTGHRGLPQRRLFTDLDKLQEGDRFYIHNIQEVLAYEVDQIRTVEPTDFDPIRIVQDQDYVTLLTCTPYMVNSHRLLVRGHRIAYTAAVEEEEFRAGRDNRRYRWGFYLLLPLLLLELYIFWRLRRRQRQLEPLEQGAEGPESIASQNGTGEVPHDSPKSQKGEAS